MTSRKRVHRARGDDATPVEASRGQSNDPIFSSEAKGKQKMVITRQWPKTVFGLNKRSPRCLPLTLSLASGGGGGKTNGTIEKGEEPEEESGF